MGFYGNINNTVKVQFSFDRVFSSRSAMVEAVNNGTDSVFAGRFVLVSYDKEVYNFPIYFLNNGSIYSNLTDAENEENAVTLAQGTIIHVPMDHDLNDASFTGYYFINENSELELVAEENVENPYLVNYLIDTRQFGAGRGYDGTVWQKMYADNRPYFAMVAELNSIVPTLAITADAPTLIPRAPHFDVDTSNVYYKLHIQSVPGLWLKPAEQDDSLTAGTDKYNTTTGVVETLSLNYPSDLKYYYPRRQTDGSVRYEATARDAAMYFNKAGFDPEVITYAEDVAEDDTQHLQKNIWKYSAAAGKYIPEDTITIDLNGKSGQLYGVEGSINQTAQPDTNEVVVMLPSIGDTMAHVWDLVYGGRDILGQHALTRNLDISWEDAGDVQNRAGLRLTKETTTGLGYQQDEVNTVAGSINTMHDLIGMIIVDATDDTYDFTNQDTTETQRADVDRIYWDNEKYYRVGIAYDPQDGTNASINTNPLPHFVQTPLNEPVENVYFDKYGQNYLLVKNASDFKKNKKYYYWPSSAQDGSKPLNQAFTKADVPERGYEKDKYYYIENGNYIIDKNELPTSGRQYYDIDDADWEPVVNGNSVIWFAPGRFYRMHTEVIDNVKVETGEVELDRNSTWSSNPGSTDHYKLFLIEDRTSSSDTVYIDVTNRVCKLNEATYYSYDAARGMYTRINNDIYADIWADDTDDSEEGTASPHKLSQIDSITLQLYTLANGAGQISLYAPGTYYYVANPITIANPTDNNYLDITVDDQIVHVIGDIVKDKSYIKDDTRTYFIKEYEPLREADSFYIANEYYVRDNNGVVEGDDANHYTLSTGSFSNTTYYERFNKAVYEDTNNVFPQYSEWNPSITVPTGVTLCWLKDKHVFEELEGYARDKNTLNGLLLETHKLFGAEDTRDLNTVHGAINSIHDLTNNFATMQAGQNVLVDHYGRLHSGPVRNGNEWININLDDNINNPSLTISHKTVSIEPTTSVASLSNTSAAATFPVPTYSFDGAGHYSGLDTKTYTLPNSYGIITGDNTGVSAEASASHDTLAMNGDNWLQATVATDQITYSHKDANAVTAANVADATPTFGGTFTITDLVFDSKGHIYETGNGSHTVTIPKGSYSNTADSGNTSVITGLSFTDTTGAIVSTSNYLGAIKLGSYTPPTGGNGISTTSTLADALSTLEARIYAEETARTGAITNLTVSDPAVIDNATATQFIATISQSNGVINATKANLPVANISNDTAGIVSLSNAIDQDDATKAATSKAVKAVYDIAVASTATWNTIKDFEVGKDINNNPITLETLTSYLVNLYRTELTPPKRLTGITVTPPTKTTYTENETLDLTGMVVTAHYSGGWPDEALASGAYTTNPANGATLATTDVSVTVTCGDYNDSFAITVNAAQEPDPEGE